MSKQYKVAIKGIGVHVPNNVITNKYLHDTYNTSENWPLDYLGIKERRWVSKDEKTSDLAFNAAKNALENSKLNIDDIDLIILATSSPDRISPSTACIVAEKLKATCPCFDINAVCSGFIYGLNIASSLIDNDSYKNILLVASETYSTITDKLSRDCVYFGDGSGAIVLSKSTTGWISTDIHADSTGIEGFTTHIGGYFKMDGKAVYEAATTQLPIAINSILTKNNTTIDQISYLVPHQPGIAVLKTIAIKIDIPFEKVITVMDKYANTAAASIPLALHHMINNQSLNNNNLVLLATVGSGWTWGTALIKWEK
jgi:3-oxoacyl-[acyl-carrier-protein] synthase-3